MDEIQISVKKNKKGDLVEGPFFVRELDIDQLTGYYDAIQKPGADEKALLAQATLCTKDGEPVFKPQQVKLIKERLSGVDYLKLLYVAGQVNPLQDLEELMVKYEKNSTSDQSN